MRWIVLFVALFAASACDDVRELLDPEGIEQQIREDPGRPGKVGALAGVAVFQHAVRVAKQTRSAPDPLCLLDVSAGQRWESTLEIERRRGKETIASWSETRSLTVANSGLEAQLSADYETRIGIAGQRKVTWRSVGDDVWLTAVGTTEPLWYRREAAPDEKRQIRTAALGSFQALLDAVDGWTRSGDGWTVGDRPLRCVDSSEGLAFIDRFVARARIDSASLDVDDAGRRLTARWVLDDQSVVIVDYRDQVESSSDEVAAPPPERVVPIERDRSLARARKLADDLASRGLVELVELKPPKDESAGAEGKQ